MKGGFLGIKGKRLSMILLISLICATILVWSWEMNPSLSYLIPPHSRWLQIPAEVRSHKEKFFTVQPSNAIVEDVSSSFSEEIPDQGVTAVSEAATSSALAPGVVTINGISGSPDEKETSWVDNKRTDGRAENLEPQKSVMAKYSSSITRLGERREEETALKSSEQESGVNVKVLTSSSSSNTSSSDHGDDEKASLEKTNHGCNYAVGKWVMDDKRPFYSGFGCKQWLSAMWSCRLTQRTEFNFERLRWQPSGCQMEEFGRKKFLKRMSGKTLAFVGDSLGRQQFQSLMCMVTGGKDQPYVMDVRKEYGLVKGRGSFRSVGWAYRFPSTNTTILFHWSASLCDLEHLPTNDQASEIAMHLDRPPAFLKRHIKDFDVLVLNTGHHWNRGKFNVNHWVMYMGGFPNTDRRLEGIGNAKNFTIHSIVRWVNLQLPKYPRLKAFFRTLSPRHFSKGNKNTGGSCNNVFPTCLGKEVVQEVSRHRIYASAVKGTGVRLLDITALSRAREEGHISRFSRKGAPRVHDCLHWCLPGVPDSWNEILFAQI